MIFFASKFIKRFKQRIQTKRLALSLSNASNNEFKRNDLRSRNFEEKISLQKQKQ